MVVPTEKKRLGHQPARIPVEQYALVVPTEKKRLGHQPASSRKVVRESEWGPIWDNQVSDPSLKNPRLHRSLMLRCMLWQYRIKSYQDPVREAVMFTTYYIQNGKWVKGFHNWATGIGFLMYSALYRGAFPQPMPPWLFYLPLFDRVMLLKKAVESKTPVPNLPSEGQALVVPIPKGNWEPIPEARQGLYYPLDFPGDMAPDDRRWLRETLGFELVSEN